MGPQGFKALKEKLSDADFTLEREGLVGSGLPHQPTEIDPEIKKNKEAVPFVQVTAYYEDGRGSLDILNALSSMVTMDPDYRRALDGQEVGSHQPLLHPIEIGETAVKFLDVHYPDSK